MKTFFVKQSSGKKTFWLIEVGNYFATICVINWILMAFIVYVYFGGSPSPSQGGGYLSGDYLLVSHGHATVVSENLYEYLFYYELASWCLFAFCAILICFLPKKKSDTQPQNKGPILSKKVMKFIYPIFAIVFLYLFVVLIQLLIYG